MIANRGENGVNNMYLRAMQTRLDKEIEENRRLRAEKVEMLALVQSIKHAAFKQSLADGERMMDIRHFIADCDKGSQFGPFELISTREDDRPGPLSRAALGGGG